MNKKELKGLIKEVVKECMAEMLMELKFENIIESAMSKMTVQAPSRNLNEQKAQAQQVAPTKQKPKTNLREKMGISEQEWKNIYSSVDSENPILSEVRGVDPISSQPKPPEVDAADLAEAGLYRDYSKFL